jgi:outer membrane receptor for ferrienterochelin and colicins
MRLCVHDGSGPPRCRFRPNLGRMPGDRDVRWHRTRARTGRARLAAPWVALALTWGLAPPGVTQEVSTADLADLSIDELMQVEVVVSASRYEQEARTAPASITIVPGVEIRERGYRTLAEALGAVRGFYTSYDHVYEYVGTRGFQRPGDYNTRFLLLVDGHRQNDAIYQTASFGAEFPVDVDLIDRIEIVRGPSSSVYGTSAMLGVVNVVTRGGGDLNGIEVSAGVGSAGTGKGRVTYGRPLGQTGRIILSGTLYDSRGRELYFEALDNPETGDGYVNNDGDRYGSLFGKAKLGDWTLEAAHVLREKGVPTGAWGTVADDDRNKVWDGTTFADLRWERTLRGSVGASAGLHYHRYIYDGDYVFESAAPEDPSDLFINKDKSVGESVGGDFRIVTPRLGRHLLSAGVEYRDNIREDQKNYDEEVYLDSRERGRDWGLYVQDELTIHEKLLATVGLRHDQYETFGGATNPRFALILLPTPSATVKLLYGEAFRAPSPYEMYYEDSGATQKPNPDLAPETISTFEIAFEQNLGQHWRGTVAGFAYELDDIITLVTDPTDTLLIFSNTERVRSNGVELEVERRSASGWRGRASWSFQRAQDAVSGERLTNSPEQLAALGLTLPLLDGRAEIGLDARYVASQVAVSGTEVDPHAIVNLNIRAPRLWGRWEASLLVTNVFDARYRCPVSDEHPQDSLEQDGRAARAQLVARF